MKIKELFNRQQARYSVKVVVAWLWSIWQGNRLQALLNVLVGVLSVVNSLMQNFGRFSMLLMWQQEA